MLNVENVTFSYGRRKKDVLSHFSLSVGQGHICGLLGKNGTGKSTLLYLMSGLLTPRHGRVTYQGVDVRLRRPATLSELFIVPEEFELPATPLRSYVKLNGAFYPRFSEADMNRYLQLFEMEPDVHLGALSMGQKKKVFISFALATNTALLLMDEPTNGLDIPGKSQFRKLMAAGMSDDKTILISTHQVRDIDRLLDYVIVMDQSRLLLDSPVADICRRFSFKESADPELARQALYTLPSPQGNSLMLPNDGGEETDINLELLFGATLTMPDRVTALLGKPSTYIQKGGKDEA